MQKIVFCGGGTAGHVVPNINIIKSIQSKYEIYYIGTGNNIEKTLLKDLNVYYYKIPTGKLRRYFDIKNFIDIFKFFLGIIKSYFLLLKIKPNLIFSKGGYAAVPVVIAGYLHKIPIITHESDFTVGLANKIIMKFANIVCFAFDSIKYFFDKNWIELDLNNLNQIKSNKKYFIKTGIPILIYNTNISKDDFYIKYGLDSNKKTLFFLGGSQGAKFINDIVLKNIDNLLKNFNVIHQCGKLNIDYIKEKIKDKNIKNYYFFEFLSQQEIANFYIYSNLIISRSGATTLFEILSYKKKSLLIPLPMYGSRGDQIQNANLLKSYNLVDVIYQQDFTDEIFFKKIYKLLDDISIEENIKNYKICNDIIIYNILIDKAIQNL